MERISEISIVLQPSALAPTNGRSPMRLPDAQADRLAILLAQMADRYPSQDLADSMEGYLWDYERLALRYSMEDVTEALAEWRITPGAKFFPRPDEIADSLASMRDHRHRAAEAVRMEERRQADIEHFWKIARERLATYGEWTVNGVVCRSEDEINQVPGSYRGTRPR